MKRLNGMVIRVGMMAVLIGGVGASEPAYTRGEQSQVKYELEQLKSYSGKNANQEKYWLRRLADFGPLLKVGLDDLDKELSGPTAVQVSQEAAIALAATAEDQTARIQELAKSGKASQAAVDAAVKTLAEIARLRGELREGKTVEARVGAMGALKKQGLATMVDIRIALNDPDKRVWIAGLAAMEKSRRLASDAKRLKELLADDDLELKLAVCEARKREFIDGMQGDEAAFSRAYVALRHFPPAQHLLKFPPDVRDPADIELLIRDFRESRGAERVKAIAWLSRARGRWLEVLQALIPELEAGSQDEKTRVTSAFQQVLSSAPDPEKQATIEALLRGPKTTERAVYLAFLTVQDSPFTHDRKSPVGQARRKLVYEAAARVLRSSKDDHYAIYCVADYVFAGNLRDVEGTWKIIDRLEKDYPPEVAEACKRRIKDWDVPELWESGIRKGPANRRAIAVDMVVADDRRILGMLPMLRPLLHDPDGAVREKVLELMTRIATPHYNMADESVRRQAQDDVIDAFFGPDPAMQRLAGEHIWEENYLKDSRVTSGIKQMLRGSSTQRASGWALIGRIVEKGDVYGLPSDAEVQQQLARAVWDEDAVAQAAARGVWGQMYGSRPLPRVTTPKAMWMIGGLVIGVVLAVVVAMAVGSWMLLSRGKR